LVLVFTVPASYPPSLRFQLDAGVHGAGLGAVADVSGQDEAVGGEADVTELLLLLLLTTTLKVNADAAINGIAAASINGILITGGETNQRSRSSRASC
jgi:hypothetical protein